MWHTFGIKPFLEQTGKLCLVGRAVGTRQEYREKQPVLPPECLHETIDSAVIHLVVWYICLNHI